MEKTQWKPWKCTLKQSNLPRKLCLLVKMRWFWAPQGCTEEIHVLCASKSFCQSYLKEIIHKCLKLPLPLKAKGLHFKIFIDKYCSGELFRQRFDFDHYNFIFCVEEIETTDHLNSCDYSNTFWCDVLLARTKNYFSPPVLKKYILCLEW